MAKLLTYYRLCPLIDTENLLGVSEDLEKGVVIVTLGKNMVIKYRLSDQKQLFSWRTKEKFTSPVLYDKKQEKYVAVFNHTFIKLWNDEEDNLNKLKKYRFNQHIYSVITHNGETYVVFNNGSIYPLSEILDSRKNFIPEPVIENMEIYDVLHTSLNGDLYFGYLVKEDVFSFYWTCFTRHSKNVFSKIKLNRDQASLSGYILHAENDAVDFLTVWNDGKMHSQKLKHTDVELKTPGEFFTVLENISADQLVKMVPLDENYIAIYGADQNEEGASLLIYNKQFKVIQSKQLHKLYSNNSKIWRTDNNILLPVGQYLVVVPFCLETEQLAALVGSHKALDNKADPDVTFVTEFEKVSWVETSDPLKNALKIKSKTFSTGFKSLIDEYLEQGHSESMIIEEILPGIFENNNVRLLHDSLNFFTDIPEKCLAKILKYLLCTSNFEKLKSYEMENVPKEFSPAGRVVLLNQILIRPYNYILLLPQLRYELSVDQAVLLLKYLVYMLSDEGHNLPHLDAVKTQKCIIDWASLVIDANYQKFILSKDKDIEEVLIHCKTIVLEHLEVIEELKKVAPVLSRFEREVKGSSFGGRGFSNSTYVVEQINLY